MAEGSLTEEIVELLKEKYLFNRIHPNFLDTDVSLVSIYLRLLTVYDGVNEYTLDEENVQISSNLRHILRCLRPLGLSYLAQNPKELLDKKKATRIISALHDKISSKYGKSLSQRVRQIIKKEQILKTCSTFKKPNSLEEQTVQPKPADSALHTEDQVPKDPFERKIPKGRQIPRTPLKTEENDVSAAEERWKEPAPLIPPPPKFNDSPEKEEKINPNTDLQNISSHLLTPPSEFCDSSSSADYPKSLESDLNETPESKSGDVNDVSVSSEKPSAMFNKRLTYCINKKLEDSGVSYSSSETSLIEENDSLADGNACRPRSSIAVVDTCTTKESNKNVSCLPGEGSRFQDEVSDIFTDNEPSLYNAAVRNRLPVVNKRRTYCIPKIPNIPEKIEENLSKTSEEEDSSDSNNERRTNSRTCRSEKITEGSMRDYCSKESTFDSKNKRRTFVIQQDPGKPTIAKESDCNISHESNESNDDMDNTINKKALFIDIIKNDVSFIDRGEFPRGRELSRTPPSTNSSFEFNHHIGISNNIGTPTSVRSVNKFITIPESKTVPNVNCAETHELEKCNQDATFTVKSGDSSYIFDDSLALFPCKKRLNGKIANDNHLDEEESTVNREEEPDEDVRQNKVGRKTMRSRVAQVGSILASQKSDSNILASEKTKIAKKTRNIVSKTSDVLSDIKQTTVAKDVEAHIDQNEKHEEKEVSEGNQGVEDIGSRVFPIVERAIIDDLEKKGKSKSTRRARKGRKENIELINEEDPVIKSQLKPLDSDKCQPKLSQKKSQAKETKSVLKTDIEDAKPITKTKRVIKPRTKNVKNENLKEFEISVNAADNVKNKELDRLNLQVLEENESDVNLNEETFLKPNSDTLKKLTERKGRMKKYDSSNGGQETDLENTISSRPVRRNRTQKTHDEETKNVGKQNIITPNHMEDGNGCSFQSASEVKNGPKTRTSRNKTKDEVSSQEKESEENETPDKDISLFNKLSNIEKTIQNERPGRKIRSSRVAMMVEKFEKTENDHKELKSKISIRRGRNSKIEIDKQNDEFKIGDEKDIKSNRKINSTKISENEDNKENYVMDEIKNVKKEEIKSKARTKGRQKKMTEEEDKENENNDKGDSENDQIIKPKNKPKQRKNKEETEKCKPKIEKKPLVENNENKSSVLENEYRRPSRKCKSYAKLAITDMLSSSSE